MRLQLHHGSAPPGMGDDAKGKGKSKGAKGGGKGAGKAKGKGKGKSERVRLPDWHCGSCGDKNINWGSMDYCWWCKLPKAAVSPKDIDKPAPKVDAETQKLLEKSEKLAKQAKEEVEEMRKRLNATETKLLERESKTDETPEEPVDVSKLDAEIKVLANQEKTLMDLYGDQDSIVLDMRERLKRARTKRNDSKKPEDSLKSIMSQITSHKKDREELQEKGKELERQKAALEEKVNENVAAKEKKDAKIAELQKEHQRMQLKQAQQKATTGLHLDFDEWRKQAYGDMVAFLADDEIDQTEKDHTLSILRKRYEKYRDKAEEEAKSKESAAERPASIITIPQTEATNTSSDEDMPDATNEELDEAREEAKRTYDESNSGVVPTFDGLSPRDQANLIAKHTFTLVRSKRRKRQEEAAAKAGASAAADAVIRPGSCSQLQHAYAPYPPPK